MITHAGGFSTLPDDAFKSSGTGVQTVVMWLDASGGDPKAGVTLGVRS
ncbi:hypothetical protein [Mycobacteroides abscessus]|uniref:Uncharacterized protein n=1 Tax=Mycobacteroides abscessus subsp. massiliense TaxID=1962118 RepID=A0A1U1B1M9_9MYCO|nr:hypothetical protein [Mycobacteroides abscessus]SKM34827.1 Uncharacterised protein [Mycobacteroides abscessus subsp. massiliense]SKT39061.1 Uncharacterised protein [Mycobacteroides abscessus subsp. massiliense]SKT84949.1 Uncharacterised protein [Mycobacteroides abscessus subsp. massiliense]SKX26848.1 Uncharacterised protein [Mycobacteroides abscessus subsp. massiliense]